jgi:hypothetical protein
MTIRIFERPQSGTGNTNPPTHVTVWGISGIESDFIAKAYATSVVSPSVDTPQGLLWLQNIQIDHDGFQLWTATANYGQENRNLGAVKFSYDTTGGSVHITNSKATIAKFAKAGDAAPDNKQLIGVNGDQVEGVDIILPALKLNYSFRHPAGFVSESQARYLASITGMVNSVLWHGFQPGEALLLGASGSGGTDSEAEASYSIAASANATGLTIGEIASIAKKGHEYAWIQYKDVVDGGKPIKQPKYVYVERVYDEVDFFAALGF